MWGPRTLLSRPPCRAGRGARAAPASDGVFPMVLAFALESFLLYSVVSCCMLFWLRTLNAYFSVFFVLFCFQMSLNLYVFYSVGTCYKTGFVGLSLSVTSTSVSSLVA